MSKHPIQLLSLLPVMLSGIFLLATTIGQQPNQSLPVKFFFTVNRATGIITADTNHQTTFTYSNDVPDDNSPLLLDSAEPSATVIQPSPVVTSWNDICVTRQLEISGIGMGDRHNTVNPQTVPLTDPAAVKWLLAQVAGRNINGVPVPGSVTFTTTQPFTLNQPTSNSSNGYTFEMNLEPTGQVTASVSNPGDSDKTPRGLILYAKRTTVDEWTSIGKTTNDYVWAGSPDNTHTEVFTFPALTEATDLFITAAVIDNNDDSRLMKLEATAGGVITSVTESGPTDGPLLNITHLTLTNVPTETNHVTITLESPLPTENGDSLVLVGLNVSYRCADDNADLTVTKTVNNPTPNEGEVITYTITVANNGPNNATGVQISDTLPISVTFNGYTATQNTYIDNVWSVGAIDKGKSATMTITVTVKKGTAGQTITNTAGILTVDQGDPGPGRNEDSAVITVIGADLVITKTVNNPNPNEGEVITYTITVANNGPSDVTGVWLTDTLPTELTFGGYIITQGVYTYESGLWEVGDLANTATATLIITATVDNCTGGEVTNTAIVTAAQTDPNLDSNQARVSFVSSAGYCIYLPIVCKPPPPSCYTETFTSLHNNPNIDWLISPPPPETIRRYIDGEYQIFSQNKRGVHWSRSPIGLFTNYEIRVEAYWQNYSNTGREYGLYFDRSGGNGLTAKAYRFNIDTSNKTYVLGRLLNGEWKDLRSGISQDIFNTNNDLDVNVLKVIRQGNRIELYINGKYQTYYNDNTLNNRPAGVGTNVVPLKNVKNGDVRFDNFTICSYELSGLNANETTLSLLGGIAPTP